MVSAYGIRALGLVVVTRVYHTRKRLSTLKRDLGESP